MQAPLAARRQQAVGDQHEQHLIPPRPFAAHSQPLRPELIELQFAPQHQRQPARAPLPRSAQTQFRQSDADDRGVRQQPLDAIFRKQRQGPRPRGASLQNLDRPPPRQFLRIVDLAQIQHVPLHHTPAGDAGVLDNAPVALIGNIVDGNSKIGLRVSCPSNVTNNTAVGNGTNLVLSNATCRNEGNVTP